MSMLRKDKKVGFERMDRNTFLLMMHGALWDLLEVLEDEDAPILREYTNIGDVVPKIRELMKVLEGCTDNLPATKALLNDLILAEVFKDTDVSDLHYFRLVNRKWNYFATQTLSQRESLKISFNASVVENRVNTNFNKFPISAIELDVSTWYDCSQSQEMSEFLKNHGPHIRTISLSGRKLQMQNFVHVFANWLLNSCFTRVENLIFESNFRGDSLAEPNNRSLNYPHIVLPSLKHLHIKCLRIPGYVVEALIHTALNLETVRLSEDSTRRLGSDVLRKLHSRKKIKILKQYIVSSDFVYESVFLASKNPLLECLELRQYPRRTAEFIRSVARILTSSRVTLTSLKVYAFNFILESSIVTIPNLKHLDLYNNKNCGPISAVFPNGTILSVMFPRLESLVLTGLILQKNEMKIYFPDDTYESDHLNDPWGEVTNPQVDTLMTVKFLELHECSLTKFGLNAFAKKFPNVNSLVFSNSMAFLQEETLWHLPWTQLEYLELGGLILGGLVMNSSLDSIFTGFSEDTCKQLRGGRQEADFLVDLEALTEYPSIRELRNLQKLKLVFDSLDESAALVGAATFGGENGSDLEVAGFSWLTGRYAFEEMPNLRRVVIAYDKKQSNSAVLITALESIASSDCVALVHKPPNRPSSCNYMGR